MKAMNSKSKTIKYFYYLISCFKSLSTAIALKLNSRETPLGYFEAR